MDFLLSAAARLRRSVLVLTALLAAVESRATTSSDLKAQALLRDPSTAEWAALSRYNGTVPRQAFEDRLNRLFDPWHGLSPYLVLSKDQVQVFSSLDHRGAPLAVVTFARGAHAVSRSREDFRSPAVYRARTGQERGGPLGGLRVAIEPADIGGRWAKAEDRSVLYPRYGIINEGDLNLIVGRLLSEQLMALGASVFLVRDRAEPVAGMRAEDLQATVSWVERDHPWMLPEAYRLRMKASGGHPSNQAQLAAELLLTKAIETRARAALVRERFNPDITIVLQHDASADSGEGHLASLNRNIFFVNGAYSKQELDEPEQRFRLLTKLFQDVSPIEIAVADRISERFKTRTGYPPLLYGDSSSTRLVIPHNPYVVARNLAFNREHDGPVVVTEPYFMNEPVTAARLLAGDFKGERMIAGRNRPSIFREYATTVTDGLLDAYSR